MKRPPSMPLVVPVAVLCLGLLMGEGWWLHRAWREATHALAALKQKKQERDWLLGQAPALSPANEAAVATDLAASGRSLAEWRASLQGVEPDPGATAAPVAPVDAFFELAGFVRQLRAKAAQAQVTLRAEENFGFAAHAQAVPSAGQVVPLHRQRVAAQFLVEQLLEARPLALLAVRRERPAAEAGVDRTGSGDDFFEPDRASSLRQPGKIETEAFRLEFTGPTAALRHFLNALGTSERPVVVRSVEVAPLAAANPPGRFAGAGSSGGTKPLVAGGPVKIGVTVEFVRLADNPGAGVP